MGTVYRADIVGRVPGLPVGESVALKVLHPHLLETPGFFQRFLREADIGRAVRHPNVVRTLLADAVVEDGTPHHVLVMEYVEGQTLRDLLDDLKRVPEELCLHIGREIAAGLEAIHAAGAIHRDLKPENVLITPEQQLKIMDLGVARLQDEALRLSLTGHFVGSLLYAAPEAFRKQEGGVDGRYDLHGLGLVLYELATGVQPFLHDEVQGVLRRVLMEDPRKAGELNPQLSPFFEEVVHTLLAKSPDDRMPSAAALGQVLAEGETGAWWKERARAVRTKTRRPLRRIRVPRETALYGRVHELETLQSLYADAREGHGRVLLLEGEAGIGKTRLIDEFAGRLQKEGEDLDVLYGSYPPGGAATISGAFSAAYADHLGLEDLDAALAAHLPSTPRLVPALAALLRGEAPPAGEQALAKESLQAAFVHLTRSLASERPTIVVIDDLHFAPEEGRALFAALGMAVRSDRVLLVGTHRPGLSDQWMTGLTRLDHTAQLTLERLGARDLADLLAEAFQSRRLANRLGMQIVRKSDGNPFFTFEIIRGLREGSFLTRRPDGTWMTTRDIADIEVPASLTDLIRARLRDLTDEQRQMLEIAACSGYEFDPLLVAAVTEQPKITALRSLATVERDHRLVRAVGRRYRFDHHQIQEALYRDQAEPLREAYHAAIAEAVANEATREGAALSEITGMRAVEIFEHYLRAGRAAEALPLMDAALSQLESVFQHDRVLELARLVLTVEGLLVGVPRAELLLRVTEAAGTLGRPEVEQELVQETSRLADELGDVLLQSKAARGRGVYAVQQGALEEAREHHEQAGRLAREAGYLTGVAQAANNVGLIDAARGRYDQARELMERARRNFEEAGDDHGAAIARLNVATTLMSQHRSEEALLITEEAVEELAAIPAARFRAQDGRVMLGDLLMRAGRLVDARVQVEANLARARELGDRRQESVALAILSAVLRRLDEREQARDCLESALELVRDTGYRPGELNILANLSGLALDAGDYAQAIDVEERGWTLATELGKGLPRLECAVRLSDVFRRVGRNGAARKFAERALDIGTETDCTYRRPFCHAMFAELALEAGDVETAAAEADRAYEFHRGLSPYPHGWWVLATIADARRAVDSHADVAALLEESASLDNLEAKVRLVKLRGEDVDAGLVESVQQEKHSVQRQMLARFVLWEATATAAHLDEAHRLLRYIQDHVPDADRGSVVKSVRQHRAIQEAWAAHCKSR